MPTVARVTPFAVLSVLFAAVFSLPALAEKRVALVIGNAAYVAASPLANPVNDATDIGKSLEALGFTVILGIDLDKPKFDLTLRAFARELEDAGTGLLFYAGHGLQVGGQNYLIPVDAKLARERDLAFEAIPLDLILRQMELERETKTNIVFLDACRDNPLARNLARSMGTRSNAVASGLAQVQTGVGTFISYSTQPGNVALDGSGRNSPFTAALSRHVKAPGASLNSIMINVRKDVLAATQGKQVPWDHSALTGDFYFDLAAVQVPARPEGGSISGDQNAMKERLGKLEEELQKKSAAADAATAATLAQLKQRVRQLQDENRAEQDRSFRVQRESAFDQDSQKRMAGFQEQSRIQQGIQRRRKDIVELEAEIARLSGGTPAIAGAGTSAKP
ncbi:MAG: caspase domain-containing protein [Hyphomicrobium aestuarii]|nr:caspase domain-containing protein [Hyphomicrobium aestuarii]